MKNKVLVKLAQTRLAINHVLRQRMTKRAEGFVVPQYGSDPNKIYTVRPYIGANTPYLKEEDLLPDEGYYVPGREYRPIGWKGDLDMNNPNYRFSVARDAAGSLWNSGLRYWNRNRIKNGKPDIPRALYMKLPRYQSDVKHDNGPWQHIDYPYNWRMVDKPDFGDN